jgi:DNA-directed RNA polymerase sigma subunit (sigma70/sigma32)
VSDALSLALVESLDDVALERLAIRLGPRLVDVVAARPTSLSKAMGDAEEASEFGDLIADTSPTTPELVRGNDALPRALEQLPNRDAPSSRLSSESATVRLRTLESVPDVRHHQRAGQAT